MGPYRYALSDSKGEVVVECTTKDGGGIVLSGTGAYEAYTGVTVNLPDAVDTWEQAAKPIDGGTILPPNFLIRRYVLQPGVRFI
jgi:hypothetical protein